MATKSKKTGAKRKPLVRPILHDSTCPQYVYLRTLLDSAEIGSLRYYLNSNDSVEKGKKLAELEPLLKKVIDLVWGGAKAIQCPPGYTSCDGCCVPYACYHGG